MPPCRRLQLPAATVPGSSLEGKQQAGEQDQHGNHDTEGLAGRGQEQQAADDRASRCHQRQDSEAAPRRTRAGPRRDPPGQQPSEQQILARAARHSVALDTLAGFWYQPPDPCPQAVIVGYSTPASHAFRPALHALGQILAAPSQVPPATQRPDMATSATAAVPGGD
jgi:hypothetical protein